MKGIQAHKGYVESKFIKFCCLYLQFVNDIKRSWNKVINMIDVWQRGIGLPN